MKKILIVFFTLFLAAAFPQVYTPLTDLEIEAYISSISRQELYDDIRKLDIIEHSVPDVKIGDLVIVYTDDGKMKIYMTDKVVVNVAGYLEYGLEFPVWVKDQPKYDDGFLWKLGTAGGIVGTVIFGVLYFTK